MELKESTLEAFGMDWGVWVRDCSVPFSRIDFPDTIDFEVTIDATGLSETIKSVASFVGDKALAKSIDKVKKVLPQGKATFRIIIAPAASSTPCQGKPPKATVSASVILVILFSATVTVGGVAVTVDLRIREHIDNKIETCDCPPDQKSSSVPRGPLDSSVGELVANIPLSGLTPRVVNASNVQTHDRTQLEGVVAESTHKKA